MEHKGGCRSAPPFFYGTKAKRKTRNIMPSGSLFAVDIQLLNSGSGEVKQNPEFCIVRLKANYKPPSGYKTWDFVWLALAKPPPPVPPSRWAGGTATPSAGRRARTPS